MLDGALLALVSFGLGVCFRFPGLSGFFFLLLLLRLVPDVDLFELDLGALGLAL
jgi:hypothetical protein